MGAVLAVARVVMVALLAWGFADGASAGAGVQPAAAPQPGTPTKPVVAFFGVWDRAMPTLDEAGRESGFQVEFLPRSPLPTQQELRRISFLFVLNIDPTEAAGLAQRLREIKDSGPSPRVLALDRRDSQTALKRAEVLQPDDKIPAYWVPNGSVNLRRMFSYLGVTYLGRPGRVEPAIVVPERGYYLPGREEPVETIAELRKLAQWQPGAPVAAILIQQSFWVTHDTKVMDALNEALKRQGFNVAVLFAEESADMEALLREVKPDILMEDRHGTLWSDANGSLLQTLDVPYLRPISMMHSTVEEWRADPVGFTPHDRGMFLSLQERLGTIEPVVVGGLLVNTSGFRLHVPIPDRVEKFAERARSWADLRRTPNADKRIAIIYYNKSLGAGDVMRGSPTGAFLDGPESLVRFLPRLQSRGYKVDPLPKDAKEMIGWMQARGRNYAPWAQGDLEKLADQPGAVLVPVARYVQWYQSKLDAEQRAAVEARFGPPPGRFMVVQRNGKPFIVIPAIQLGNVLLAPQPERAETMDDKILHSREIPPPHSYLAFHWWLQEEYRPQAMVMWGTHGSLELLPGKEAGLSGRDWSDLLLGRIPVIYPWIMDNLGEATLARRRAYAVLIDHLPPLAQTSALSDDLQRIHDDIDKFTNLDTGLVREEFRKRISASSRAARIPGTPGGTAPLTDAQIRAVSEWLHNQEEETTPKYLHVLGQSPTDDHVVGPLAKSLRKPFLQRVAATYPTQPGTSDETEQVRKRAEQVIKDSVLGSVAPAPALSADAQHAKELLAHLRQSDHEITGVLDALDGHFVRPGPGPDPVRNPSSAPGGRNLYGLNPEEIPTQPSWEVAVKLIDDLLASHHPKKVGIDLSGMETMRDYGVTEAEVLYLLGVRPIWDHNNLAVDVEAIPRNELKHARIDVFVAMGGSYKENFPTRVRLLDKAIRLASSQTEADNGVRNGTLTLERALVAKGMPAAQAEVLAQARIFGTKPGNMGGTNILYLVPRSGAWEKETDISSVYIDSMSYVYCGDHWGERIDGLYQTAIQGTDTLVRVWASNMTSQLSNHHAYEYLGGLSMAVRALTGREPQAYIADVRNPDSARMRSFDEVIESNLRSELLNKEWLAGMKAHDYAGAGQVAELVKNTFGWAVTRPDSIDGRVWDEIHQVLVKDKYNLGLRNWFERNNPAALQEVAATLLEAARKGHWKPDPAVLRELAELYAQLVIAHGAPSGLVGGGNRKLDEQVESLAPAAAAAFERAIQVSREPSPGEKVLGQKLESKRVAARASAPQRQPTPLPDVYHIMLAALAVGLILFGFLRRIGGFR